MSEIRASHIGAEYDPERGDPLLVVRDEYGVLRPLSNPKRLANASVVSGMLKRVERDVLVLEVQK